MRTSLLLIGISVMALPASRTRAGDGAAEPSSTARPPVVAALQYRPEPGETEDNRRRVARLIREASARGARYVVLPELTLRGPLPRDDESRGAVPAEPIPGPTTEYFGRYARALGIWLAFSLAERSENGGHYVTTVLVDHEGKVVHKVRKILLRLNGEDGAAERGYARTVNDTWDDQGCRVGILSGDDLLLGVPRLAGRGATAILVTSGWGAGEPVDWSDLCNSLSRKYRVNLVVANRRGAGDASSSAARLGGIWSREGEIIAPDPADEKEVALVASLVAPADRRRPPAAPGLPSIPVPTTESLTPELVALGRTIFFDRDLSSARTVSCASCHDPAHAFSNGEATGAGLYGARTGRNVPSSLNLAFKPVLGWDGLSGSLESQSKFPITNSREMNYHFLDRVVAHVRSKPDYVQGFRSTLGVETIDFDDVASALGAYQRSLVSGNSAFDRYYYGHEERALGPAAIRGLGLFKGKAQCAGCHPIGPRYALFTDSAFHNLGIGYVAKVGRFWDGGVGGISHANKTGMFFTPPLRNVAETGPYMHDGSMKTLEEVVEFFNQGGVPNPGLDAQMRPLNLTPGQVGDLVEFLRSLTGDHRYSRSGERLAGSIAGIAGPGTGRQALLAPRDYEPRVIRTSPSGAR